MADLNYIKIRDKVFYLEQGDKIFSNAEDCYIYKPTGKENQFKIPMRGFSRTSYIPITKKYHRIIDEAENLELTLDEPSHDENRPELRTKEWVERLSNT